MADDYVRMARRKMGIRAPGRGSTSMEQIRRPVQRKKARKGTREKSPFEQLGVKF